MIGKEAAEEKLYTYVTQWVKPDETEWKMFLSGCRSRVLAKDEMLLAEGDVCRKMAFIMHGSVRMFYSIGGEERSKDFQFEGQFTGSLFSLLSKQPSRFSIVAMEDTLVFEITGDHLFSLYDKYKVWERFGRLYIEQAFLYKERREASLLFDSSTTRYEKLLLEQPHHVQRIQQKYLASYLGIKPESLSRIRRQLAKK